MNTSYIYSSLNRNFFRSSNFPYYSRFISSQFVHKSVLLSTATIIRHDSICNVMRTNKRLRQSIRTKAIDSSQLIVFSEILGKSIILFVMFYSTLNWFHYRQLREEIEKETNKKDKKK